MRRTGPVLFCSGIAVDGPARKADTAKAANVVFRFMRADPSGSRFTYNQGLPNHSLADFMCCLGSEILFSVSQINTGVMRMPLSRQSLAARQKAGWLMV